MPSYKLSRLAQSHLRSIKKYTVNNYGEQQWRSYKSELLSGFAMLAANPKLGKNCNDIYPNGFYRPVAKHTAYYTVEDGFILVVAVLGQSQLPERHLVR